MVLELLAHIGMRKNERHPQPWIFFSQEASFPALDGGVDRLSTDAFLPWPDFSSVQLLSCVWRSVTPWTAAHQASLSIINSRSLFGDAIQPSHPLSSPSPAFNLSQHQGLFRWVSSLHQVAKVLEFQLQHQSSNEHSGLISFRMDGLGLLAVQRTLTSFSNTTFQKHQFFGAQLSL